MPAPDVAERTDHASRTRVLPRDPAYFEVVTFLDDEAALLDAGDLMAWHQLLAEDIVYQAPVRLSLDRNEDPFDAGMFHIDDEYRTITQKLQRLALVSSAWAENPPSGTRRFVTGVRIWEGDDEGEFVVESSVLLIRSRFDEPTSQFLSARRSDVVRRVNDGYRLARRVLYLDQAALPMANLAVYL